MHSTNFIRKVDLGQKMASNMEHHLEKKIGLMMLVVWSHK